MKKLGSGLWLICFCIAAWATPDRAHAQSVSVSATTPTGVMSLAQPKQSVTAMISTPGLPTKISLDIVVKIKNTRTLAIGTTFTTVTTDMTGAGFLNFSCNVPAGNMNDPAEVTVKATYAQTGLSGTQTVAPTYAQNP